MKGTTGIPTRYTSNNIKYLEKLEVRKDRKPLDTPRGVHEYLDSLFNKYFGWKGRSEGLFVWSHKLTMPRQTYLVFPIGKYRYVYSDDVPDLFAILADNIFLYTDKELEKLTHIGSRGIPKEKWNDAVKDKERQEKLEKLVKTYKSKGLKELSSKSMSPIEVMIDCKEYYLRDIQFSNLIMDRLLR
jgi:hypothetical protein